MLVAGKPDHIARTQDLVAPHINVAEVAVRRVVIAVVYEYHVAKALDGHHAVDHAIVHDPHRGVGFYRNLNAGMIGARADNGMHPDAEFFGNDAAVDGPWEGAAFLRKGVGELLQLLVSDSVFAHSWGGISGHRRTPLYFIFDLLCLGQAPQSLLFGPPDLCFLLQKPVHHPVQFLTLGFVDFELFLYVFAVSLEQGYVSFELRLLGFELLRLGFELLFRLLVFRLGLREFLFPRLQLRLRLTDEGGLLFLVTVELFEVVGANEQLVDGRRAH